MTAKRSNIKNMRNLSPQQRLEAVSKAINCNPNLLNDLKGEGSLPLKIADGMIENVVGRFELPLGIATNFLVNGSVVAAASHMAKMTRASGGFQASSDRPIMRGQIQVMDLENLHDTKAKILEHKNELISAANEKDKTLVNLGGGCEDLEVHLFNETPAGPMLVVHLLVDVCDAMGANTVNTMAEHIAPLIEKLTDGRVRLRILSNLADKRQVTASVKLHSSHGFRKFTLSASQFDTKNYSGNEVIKGIFEAASFAAVDPYRAATHNKGVMNGIDPIIVVTGNDWRAIEAGAHAFAARGGHYTSLTDWSISNNGDLVGKITLPMAVGLVGGATKTHPTAKAAIEVLRVKTATELGQVIAAVGLAQNLAALRALATEGIQRGHMTLHARNIAVQAGANGSEIDLIVKGMIDSQNVTMDNAMQILKALR